MKASAIGLALILASAGGAVCAERGGAIPSQYAEMVARHAQANGVPEALVHRIIMRESRYNPKARNGPYWGMMQMSVATARGAGFRGSPSELLDADTNLRFGVRYLAGAYKTARGDHGRAVGFYARGYYYAAKRQGMLASIGMGRDGKLTPAPAVPATSQVAAAPSAAASVPVAQPVLASLPAQAPARTITPSEPKLAAAIPLPPVRPAAAPQPAAAGPTLASAAPATPATMPSVPMPPVREAAAGVRTPRTIAVSTAPVMASVAPVPRPRDEPATTGAITDRAAQSPRSGATTPQVVAPAAMAGPAIPLPTARDQKPAQGAAPQPALAYADSGKATPVPIPQPRGTANPPRR